MMSQDNNNMIKTYNIIASFSDGYLLRGEVMAMTEKAAEQKFFNSPEMKHAINVDKKKLQQYSIYEDEEETEA